MPERSSEPPQSGPGVEHPITTSLRAQRGVPRYRRVRTRPVRLRVIERARGAVGRAGRLDVEHSTVHESDMGCAVTENFRGYVQALYGFDAVVQRTAENEWNRQSPCEMWKARDVVVHVAWACELFAQMSAGIPASVPATNDGPGVPAPSDDGHQMSPSVLAAYVEIDQRFVDDPLGSWNRSRSLCLDALDQPGVPEVITRSPWGETDMDSWLGFAAWDPLVHTWDLARAVGQPVIVDAGLCERALEQAQDFDAAHNLRRPGVADDVRATIRTDPLGRLLAFAGRNLDWQSN